MEKARQDFQPVPVAIAAATVVNTTMASYCTASKGKLAGGRANMFTHLLARSGSWHCSQVSPDFSTHRRSNFVLP